MRTSAAGTGVDAGRRLDLEQQRAARRRRARRRCAFAKRRVQRQRDVERLGEVRDLLLGARRVEQRLVGAERVEAVAAARRRRRRRAATRDEPERLHAPEEDPDVRDVVAARAASRCGASRRCARTCRRRPPGTCRRQLEPALVAQVASSPRRAGGRGSCTASSTSSSKNSTARAGQPVTSRGELLEHRRRALAPAVADRVRDLGPRRRDLRHDAVQRPVADQVADVRRDPRRAGLDELVVVELLEALGEHVDLVGERRRRARAGRRPARRRGRGRAPAAAGRAPRSCTGRSRSRASPRASRTAPGRARARPAGIAVAAGADVGPLGEQAVGEAGGRARCRAGRRRRRGRRRPVCATATTSEQEHRLDQPARLERVRRAQRRLDAGEHRVASRTPGRRRPQREPERLRRRPRARAPGRAGRRARAARRPRSVEPLAALEARP